MEQHLQECSRKLHTFSPQHLANTSWALAKLGHRPSSWWNGSFQKATARVFKDFKVEELTIVVWAMAVLNVKPLAVG
jgi:hypothetical protein